MDRLLTTVAVIDRDARLRRDAAAWHHLHPTTEPPARLPIDLDVVPAWRRLVGRLTDPAAGRRDRRHPRPQPIAVAAPSR
jgi:hypothetical protein